MSKDTSEVPTAFLQEGLNRGIIQFDLLTRKIRWAPENDSKFWEESLGFEHVSFRQKKNSNLSRLHVDTTSEIIKGVFRPIPMIAANMSTVCNADFCIELYKLGALGVMHRAAPDEFLFESVEKIAEECKWVAASVGVGESQLELAKNLHRRGANIIFIDIAHGYSDTVLDIARKIKDYNPDIKVVVGNTTNTDLMLEAKDVASGLKIGIAQGAACETKNTAGCTEKQFTATLKFKYISQELGLPYISDGGIREPADMTKAIGAGANSIMAGSIFARCPESAAEVIDIDGIPNKIYAGMACYSQDTEILTEKGWKLFSDLGLEKVATLNPDTHEMTYQRPTKYYEFNHTGDMIRAKHTAIDLLVTPNHRMYVSKRNSLKGMSSFKFIDAENCINNGTFIYKKDCNWQGQPMTHFRLPDYEEQDLKSASGTTWSRKREGREIPIDEWVDFFGFYLAEGSATKYLAHSKNSPYYNENHFSYNIAISNNDKELIEHYKDLFTKWGFNPYLRTRGESNELIVSDITLYNYLQQFGKAHEKFIPNDIKNLPSEQLELLLKTIQLGDGNIDSNCIYTSSVRFRDDIAEVALKCGRTPNIGLNHEKGTKGVINGVEFERNHDVWSIYIGNYWKNPHLHEKHHSIETYNDKVYCVEVPNGIVHVRRNNKSVWCGNSRYVQQRWKGGLKDGTCPEGGVRHLPLGEPLEPFLKRWSGALKSGITYGGGIDIQSFQKEVEFFKIKTC